MSDSFIDRKSHVASREDVELHRKARKGHDPWGCLLCGDLFVEGDTYRWIYANFGGSPWRHGNFFVCGSCDDSDELCIGRAVGMAASINPLMRQRLGTGAPDA